MRLFIAVNFTGKTRSQLLDLCDELRSKSECGRYSLPENLHLTLIFLGDCDAKQTAAVKTVIDAADFDLFEITIDCVGRFKRKGGDLWWAGVRENKVLSELHRSLAFALCSNGFILEKRKYSPHITLAREVRTDINPWMIEPFGETVSRIDLMKSERLNGKQTYTSIHRREK